MTNKTIIAGGLALLLLIVGCTSGTPGIELSTNQFDLGDIDPDGGLRTETFYVKNTGGVPLVIESVSTSCGCTEAEVDKTDIQSGAQAALTVTYDPTVHPGLVGKIKRIVYIKSNDPLHEEIELELTGNMLAKETGKHEDELADFEISPFEVESRITDGGSMKLIDVREQYEYDVGHIDGSVLLPLGSINEETLAGLDLKKDDEIVLYCRSGRRSAQAYDILESLGYTDIKSMNGGIVHWTEEGLPVVEGAADSPEEEPSPGSSPSIAIDRAEHDFGSIPQFGGIVDTTFTVSNSGSDKLEIISLSTSCGCASAEVESEELMPGESTTLTVHFDPDFHAEPLGRFSRTVFIETNDPSNPEAEVRVFVDILEDE